MTRVLVVDDQVPLLRMLGQSLRERGYDVVLVTTGGQAVASIRDHAADVVILDLGLPDMGGMQVLDWIRRWSTVPVIVLSARTAESHKVAALDTGADDYITKPFNMDELLARLRVVVRDRRRSSDEPVVVTEDFTIDLAAQQVTRGGRPVRLTRTEWRIVTLMVRHRGCLITQQRLLEEVWGITEADHSNYVRVFMAAIRRKLEPDPGHPRYFITEPGFGLRFCPGPAPASGDPWATPL
jgi:two-component system, OmpR family, KDP operon response regulator KdpE